MKWTSPYFYGHIAYTFHASTMKIVEAIHRVRIRTNFFCFSVWSRHATNLAVPISDFQAPDGFNISSEPGKEPAQIKLPVDPSQPAALAGSFVARYTLQVEFNFKGKRGRWRLNIFLIQNLIENSIMMACVYCVANRTSEDVN